MQIIRRRNIVSRSYYHRLTHKYPTLNKATFYRANKFEVTKKRFNKIFTENNKDKSTIKMKEEEGMKVSKRVKGKVLCKAERIRFTARQKLSLIEEKSSQLFLSVAMK